MACSNGEQGQGSITVNPTPVGAGPFTYYYDGGSGVSSNTINNLAAGVHTVDIQANNGCYFHLSVPITSPEPLTLVYNTRNLNCYLTPSGLISFDAVGGTVPYTFYLNGVPTTSPAFSLTAGTYNLTVQDGNGCANTSYVVLTQPDALDFQSVQITNSSQCVNSGQIVINAVGGTGDYLFSIDGTSYQASNTFSNLMPNVYNIHVHDSLGCGAILIDTVFIIPSITGYVDVEQACDGTGVATFVSTFDLSGYTFTLGSLTTRSNVFYNVTSNANQLLQVTDAFGCSVEFSFNGPIFRSRLAVEVQILKNATCFGGLDSSITVIPSGGSGSYDFSIDDGPWIDEVEDEYPPGEHKIAVRDDECIVVEYFTIHEASPILLSANTEDVPCNGTEGGSFTIQASGGNPSYTYSLDGYYFSENATYENLPLGNYTFFVKDMFNCSASSIVTIRKKSFNVEASATPATCGKLGVVTFNTFDNTSNYVYLLNGVSQTSPVFSGMRLGTYSWIVTNEEGCAANGSIFVNQTQNQSNCDNRTTCEFLPSGPACSACPSGFTGTGETGCVDKNECVTGDHNCTTGQICKNIDGSFVCVRKTTGYKDCQKDNGGCARNVICTVVDNNVTCGDCPIGMVGDGYTFCKSLCGDGTCDPMEDCVTCPSDCEAPCGLCGDGYCEDLNETCTSCFSDCRSHCNFDCSGGCGVNGTCVDGLCVCKGTASGPYCQSNNHDMQMIVDTTTPSLGVIAVFNNLVMNVSLSITALSEFSPSGDALRTILISESTFDYSHEELEDGNERFNLTSLLENGAQLNVTIYLFHTGRSMEFANTTTQYLPNSVKLGVTIENWPFLALNNSLGIIVNPRNRDPTSSVTTAREVNSINLDLKWLKININNMTFYGQYSDKAVLDGFIRTIKTTVNDTDLSITTFVPHFWDSADIDPSYAVLLENGASTEPTSKGGGGVSKSLVIILPVTVGVVLIVAIFTCFAVPRIRLWYKVRRAYRRASSTTSMVEMGSESPKL